MSQPQSATRIALAIGVIGLVLGASGLAYAVYLGQSQIPSQISPLTVTVKLPSDKVFRVDWFNDPATSGQDRFFPEFITVAQGENVTIIFITNDTGDAHTFTIGLTVRGFPNAQFVLNNSAAGLSSGPYNIPKETFTAGPGNSCLDQNGQAYACNIQPTGTLTCKPAPCFGLVSTGVLGIVKVPGLYKFFCFYHQKGGMIGYLNVLPNKAYTG
jgi:plastocyanin